MKPRLALALGLVLLLGQAPVGQAQVLAADYQPGSQTLVLHLPPGAIPTMSEASNPPRLVIDLPGSNSFTPVSRTYPGGLVARYELARVPRGARATLTLRRALGGQYRVAFEGDNVRVTLTANAPPIASLPTAPPPPRATPAPVSVATPFPLPTTTPPPAPRPTATPAALATAVPRVNPTPVPLPAGTATPRAFITPEPLPSIGVAPEVPASAVFGTRLGVGGSLPLSLTEVFPAGDVDGEVSLVPGGGLRWDALLTPNFGSSVSGRAIAYSFADAALTAHGASSTHRRDIYEANLAVFGRLPLPFGFELMGAPGLRIQAATGSTTGGRVGAPEVALASQSYLSSGWLGVGGAFSGGLGWRVYGPLSLVALGDVGVLSGKMSSAGAPTIFPYLAYRVGGEARLDLGPVGLAAGYELGHGGHAGDTSGATLSQDWSGPTASLAWLF